MNLVLTRLSVFAIQAQRYLPVAVMVIAVLGVALGFKPLDSEGGTGG